MVKSNELSLNVDQPKWLLFHPLSKRKLLPKTLPNLLIKKIHIKRENVTKFLCVFIDKNLSWKQQIVIVSCRISKSIGILYKSSDVLSKQCLKQLYFLFIHNYVNYSNIIWASTTRPSLIYNASARHERHECDTRDTNATRVRHKWDTSDTSATRVKNFDFDNDTSKNIFSHHCIYYMASERLQGEEQFHSKNYLLEMSRFHAKMRLKSAPQT